MSAVALAATGVALLPLLQARRNHRETIETLRRLKEQDIAQSRDLHDSKLRVESEFEKEKISADFSMHHEYIALKLDLSRRETMRDVWLQRDLLNRTIIIMIVLMFASTYESLSQATIPPGTAPALLHMYGISLAAAQAVLIAGMWICIKIQRTSAAYDQVTPTVAYRCGKVHPDFNSYWDCHCEAMKQLSAVLFCAGACFALLALGSIETAKFIYLYDDTASIVLFGIPVLGGIVLLPAIPFIVAEEQKSSDFGGLIGITQLSREEAGVVASSS